MGPPDGSPCRIVWQKARIGMTDGPRILTKGVFLYLRYSRTIPTPADGMALLSTAVLPTRCTRTRARLAEDRGVP